MKTFRQFIDEEDYDRMKDRRLERQGAQGSGSGDDPSPRKSNYGPPESDEQKKERRKKDAQALKNVRDRILKDLGPGAIA